MMKNKIIYFIIILALVIIASNLNTFKNDFIFLDDYKFIVNNPEIRNLNLQSIVGFFSPSKEAIRDLYIFYQPLRILTFAIDYQLYGLNPWGFHLTNVLFFLLACMAAFYFAFVLTNKIEIAFWTALFFSLHPVHVEAVVWINARHYSLALLFVFLCLSFYAKKKEFKWAYPASVICYFAAVFSHSVAIVAPLLVFLYDIHFRQKEKGEWRQLIRGYLPYLFIGCLAYVLFQYYETCALVSGSWRTVVAKVVTRLGVPFGMLAFPFNLYYHGYNFQVLDTPYVIEVLKTCFLLVSFILIFALNRFYKKNRIKAFSLFWIFAWFLPALPQSIFERYLFIPSFGFCLLVATYLEEMKSKTSFFRPQVTKLVVLFLSVSLAALYFVVTVKKNTFWRNNVMFSKNLSNPPKRVFAEIPKKSIQVSNSHRTLI